MILEGWPGQTDQRSGQGTQIRGLARVDRPESCLEPQYTQIPSKEFYFLKKKQNLQVSLGGWSVLYIQRMVLYIEENNNNVENVQFGPWNPKKPSSPQHDPQDGPQVVEQALLAHQVLLGCMAPQARARSGVAGFLLLLTVPSCLFLPVSPQADRRDFLFSLMFIQNLPPWLHVIPLPVTTHRDAQRGGKNWTKLNFKPV